MILEADFFDQGAAEAARALLGKVVRHRYRGLWLAARIIETEAYYKNEKGSHASLGPTPSRRALFAPPGTIYMYYARGGDSLNFSCRGGGNAVLIKSGIPYFDRKSPRSKCLPLMQKLNPKGGRPRPPERLCSGQTLLCKSLALKVPEWNDRMPERKSFTVEDAGLTVTDVVQCPRLGIPKGRDEHLPLRFVDASLMRFCTKWVTSTPVVSAGDHRSRF